MLVCATSVCWWYASVCEGDLQVCKVGEVCEYTLQVCDRGQEVNEDGLQVRVGGLQVS